MKKSIITIITVFLFLINCKSSKLFNSNVNIIQFKLVSDIKNENNKEYIMKGNNEKLLLNNEVLLNLKDIENVKIKKNWIGFYCIEIQFNKNGTKKFEEITKNNIHKKLGIIVDNELLTAPKIMEKIENGKASFGSYSIEEAKIIYKYFFN